MTDAVLRIHPAFGFARVGNSDDYYLAPETSAGLDQEGTQVLGGLPIKRGTESDPISDKDLRDANGALKRQAQRFRIYSYDDPEAAKSYPYKGDVTEITIGSPLGKKRVTEIVWTVHLANKKANCWTLQEEVPRGEENLSSMQPYNDGGLPRIRNKNFAGTSDPASKVRLEKLVIDAGPRAIGGATAPRIVFEFGSTPSYYKSGAGITSLPSYPVSYPAQQFDKLNSPSGTEVAQLGAIETDKLGRLIVIGGQGTATGWYHEENGGAELASGPFELTDDVDNDGWFDDTADGPVTAVLVFDDGSNLALDSTAWIVSTDPAYAPQVRNVVNLWDEVFNTWVTCFGLDKTLYDGPCNPLDPSGFQTSYFPSFKDDIYPIFRAAHLQMFTTSLNELGQSSHRRLDDIKADSEPARYLNVQSFIRSPYQAAAQPQTGAPQMPLALGDTGASFLVLSKTQYFFLNQWFANKYRKDAPVLTAGELLDKNVLTNCLGGRFSPGIDMTFLVRDTAFYDPNWNRADIGPFRTNAKTLEYESFAQPVGKDAGPFLGVGYIPEREDSMVEPGDICKFMAIPWHTDYNSCATHLPSPNPPGTPDSQLTDPDQVFGDINTTLLWSWPAQRPVSVYAYKDLVANNGKLPAQRFSVRGENTGSIPGPNNGVWPVRPPPNPPWGAGPDGTFFEIQQVGRFQVRENMVKGWQDIGTMIQGVAIEGYDPNFDQRLILEVESRMTNASDLVQEWPNNLTDKVIKTE